MSDFLNIGIFAIGCALLVGIPILIVFLHKKDEARAEHNIKELYKVINIKILTIAHELGERIDQLERKTSDTKASILESYNMNILIACEFSGVVRNAFLKQGHNVFSCDLYENAVGECNDRHFRADALQVLTYQKWDMLIAFPPCTHLAVSGARHFAEKRKDGRQQYAIDFFMKLVNADVDKIAIENPIGIMSTQYRRPDQIIQPWQFGHGETKATCLWLKNLPKLQPTNIVSGREQRIHMMPPSKDRAKLRSITYQGIADAMAKQWGYIE